MKTFSLILFLTAISSQAATFKCSEDLRPVDGSLTEIVLSETSPTVYQAVLTTASGGLCPNGPCGGRQSAVIAEGMFCDFGTPELPLVNCYHATSEGNHFFEVKKVTTQSIDKRSPTRFSATELLTTETWSLLVKSLSESMQQSAEEKYWNLSQCKLEL